MARKLFGTDGVRGVAGDLLTAELALALGRAVTLEAAAERPQVLVIRDTRESGEMLEAALAAGVTAAGGDVLLGGVLPTPAAPLLIRRYGFDVAAVISASHNPFRDNGIKFFGADGMKLSDATEVAIERRLERPIDAPGGDRPRPRRCTAPWRTTCGNCTRGSRTCRSTGSTCCWTARTARPSVPRRRSSGGWARPSTVVANEPDGRNINAGVRLDARRGVRREVAAGGHAVGFAFDGDGDRVLAVDRNGPRRGR